MSHPELLPRIWADIVYFLQRPRPKYRTEDWSELHQNDLAIMMRVSKMHFQVTAPLLYREPIIENVWSFLQSVELPLKVTPAILDARRLQPLPKIRLVQGTNDPVIETSKAFCYQYTKHIHVIHTKNSYSFSYFEAFFVHHEGHRNRCWEYATKLEYPTMSDTQRWDITVYGASLVSCHENELGLLFEYAQRSPSHLLLRPEKLTFGAYGDLSWVERQRITGRTFSIGAGLQAMSPSDRKTARENLLYTQQKMASTAMNTYIKWSQFQPKIHCSWATAGPIGQEGQPFLTWNDPDSAFTPHDPPKTTFIHINAWSVVFGVTLGYSNTIILHPCQQYLSDPDRALEVLRKTLQYIHRSSTAQLRSGEITMKQLAATTIDIYARFDVASGNRTVKGSRIKAVQAEIDRALKGFRAKITLRPFAKAPECPGCGWTVPEDDEKRTVWPTTNAAEYAT